MTDLPTAIRAASDALLRELDVAEDYLIGIEQVVGETADLLQLPLDHCVSRVLDGGARAIVRAIVPITGVLCGPGGMKEG